MLVAIDNKDLLLLVTGSPSTPPTQNVTVRSVPHANKTYIRSFSRSTVVVLPNHLLGLDLATNICLNLNSKDQFPTRLDIFRGHFDSSCRMRASACFLCVGRPHCSVSICFYITRSSEANKMSEKDAGTSMSAACSFTFTRSPHRHRQSKSVRRLHSILCLAAQGQLSSKLSPHTHGNLFQFTVKFVSTITRTDKKVVRYNKSASVVRLE